MLILRQRIGAAFQVGEGTATIHFRVLKMEWEGGAPSVVLGIDAPPAVRVDWDGRKPALTRGKSI